MKRPGLSNRQGVARLLPLVSLIAVSLVAAACSSSSDGASSKATSTTSAQADASGQAQTSGQGEQIVGDPIGKPTSKAAFDVQGGIGFVAVTDASHGAILALFDSEGEELQRKRADRFGSVIFRDLKPAEGLTIRTVEGDKVAGSSDVAVLDFADHPEQSFYDEQEPVTDGYQYLTTRDGTTLAITVRLPGGKTVDDGPFPTLINMSGYADADPDSAPPMTQIASVMGYATVSVNERGSGCSGGVNGLFDLTWTADGYDVVESIAAQKWSANVGLTGISFPGITQLFTAGAQPPHLAAITPMSVIADVYRSPGYPGGIFNNGFTESWLTDRRNDARPAPEDGQGYAISRVKDGDKDCLANQALRLQTIDPIGLVNDSPYRDPGLSDPRSGINWVDKIEVPTLLMGAWQDEQVGSDFAHLFPVLPRRPDVKAVASNGVHSTPIEPELLSQWLAFVDIYVAEQVPDTARLASIASVIAPETQGGDKEVGDFPANPYEGDTLAEAKTRYEALPRFRVLFDSGGEKERPGVPGGGFERGYDTWPPKEATVTRWYLGADGTLGADKPADEAGLDRYFPTTSARPMQTIPGQGQSESWVLLPDYDWRPLVADTAVAYATEPLKTDTAMLGSGSVDLWLRSSTPDTDLQVAVTEVRPDGTEIYVQNGWLRASHRKLDPERTTETVPWPTHLESDGEPLPVGEWAEARVEIMPVAHVFRKDSRFRISVSAPGGDRTRWAFKTATPPADAVVEIGRSADHPSSVALSLIESFDAPTPAPVCPGLRGEPCRRYEKASNGG